MSTAYALSKALSGESMQVSGEPLKLPSELLGIIPVFKRLEDLQDIYGEDAPYFELDVADGDKKHAAGARGRMG